MSDKLQSLSRKENVIPERRRLMIKTLLFLMLFVFLSAPSVLGQSILPETDVQEWTDVQLSVPVTNHIDFNVLGTLRIGRDVSRPVDERIGVGFTFKAAGRLLTFAPNYLHIGMQPFERRKGWENRLSFPVSVFFEVNKFRITDRNLFESRWRSPGTRSTRYRNRLRVEHSIGSDKLKLSLFASDEVFYDWSVNDWVRNRASAGIVKALSGNVTLDLYYLRQNDGRSRPGDLHVIGTVWRIRL